MLWRSGLIFSLIQVDERSLREKGELTALQSVVQRAARLAEKGDLSSDNLSPTDVVDPSLFESPSEKGMHAGGVVGAPGQISVLS